MLLRRLFNLLPWISLIAAALLLGAAFSAANPWARFALALPGTLLAALGTAFVAWRLRPNTARIDPALGIETWDVAADAMHNSNTDLICRGEYFYLVHAVSPYHFYHTDCHLRLLRSADARTWEPLAQIASPGEDIRDPKLASIGGRLFLYALVNRSFDPEPYTTVYTSSDDEGRTWAPLQRMAHEGWLFWKPKTLDGRTWYAAAYWHEHGRSALYATEDGVDWRFVSAIHSGGERNDETDIEFLPDGGLLSTARIEGDFHEWEYGMFFGDPGGATLISCAAAPFDRQDHAGEAFTPLIKSPLTRLDGPALFSYRGQVYAVGRFQPELARPFLRQGSIFARKRTAIFRIDPAPDPGLVWLSDVPSAGDTAYAGVALHAGCLYFSYYTSRIDRDVPWIIGMFNPTAIRMAKVELEKLALAGGFAGV